MFMDNHLVGVHAPGNTPIPQFGRRIISSHRLDRE